MNEFRKLRDANERRDSEWDPDDKITPGFRGLELAGEAGEVANVLKKLERQNIGIVGSRATTQDLEEELADVIIAVDLLAMEFGINLFDAIQKKFNKTSEKYLLKTRLELWR